MKPQRSICLTLKCFTYLNRALESRIAPIVILASNRGKCTIRGTGSDLIAAHGVPPDLLARLLIIPTTTYSSKKGRPSSGCGRKPKGLAISDAALEKVSEHGVKVSLRYALQLLTPASILSRVNGKETDVDEVAKCEDLFIDARRSAMVIEGEDTFIS